MIYALNHVQFGRLKIDNCQGIKNKRQIRESPLSLRKGLFNVTLTKVAEGLNKLMFSKVRQLLIVGRNV